MNKRRALVFALGLGALAAPFRSLAQQPGKVWRIGFLMENDSSYYPEHVAAFKAGLRDLGYVEVKDYVIEQRAAKTDLKLLDAMAAELLASKLDIILSFGTPSALALSRATRDIPILIASAGDPVGSGLAASLRRPGGNVTGLTGQTTELATKHLDLLLQVRPGIRRIGFLHNPNNKSDALGLKQFESDCAKLHVTSIAAPLNKLEEITAVFNLLKRDNAQGLIVTNAGSNNAWRASITEHASRYRLPAVYGRYSMIEAGGLMSYAPDNLDLYRRVAAYAVKIFKGANAAGLPIEQPVKFEMFINGKAAKGLGVKIPDSILLRADKVIE